MVDKLIEWIRSEEAIGYTSQQLYDALVKQGYNPEEIRVAIDSAGQNNVESQTSSVGIKRRNPFLVFLFSFITLGIYSIFWLVYTTNELRKNTRSAPNPWLLLLMIIPFVNFVIMFYYYWKYSEAINELTGFSFIALYLLWIFISPVGMILSQIELNKKAV